ncbi:flagellar protein [Parablautia intestinalis]|jgi:flagellar operon protein|uniref:Flagellar protein n=2 Tax=Parablautia intestinalis TaxID=2320100 RepID=A0A3A9AQ64_9FIRM|nr:TIGR02530 family flagellar biosynthesis protein [Parablautia intestinalis]MCI8614264.1 flagellar protein [Lachnospiraceae bacterium]MDE7046376.1 flagellar protein [Lachnospiraceae bacterium]RKI93650.1 flagellar protein [Parablautia intestinalis]
MNMQVQNKGFLSIEQLQDQYLKQNKSGTSQVATEGQSFQEILENSRARAQGQVRFSKHAAGRLADRNIELTTGQMERLQEGAQKAQMKGIRESLVIVDQLAFIVNIPNNTVVTAMNQQDAAENVFTNIDGAVII